jgi:hypothetical protein
MNEHSVLAAEVVPRQTGLVLSTGAGGGRRRCRLATISRHESATNADAVTHDAKARRSAAREAAERLGRLIHRRQRRGHVTAQDLMSRALARQSRAGVRDGQGFGRHRSHCG